MVQSADGLRENTPHQHHTVTPSMALARLMEAIDQVKSLTRRSAAKDALWDVTESVLRTLRNKFNSRLWLLKALWYAEPIRLVTVGRWLSRIDKETINELNALDAHIQTRNGCDHTWTTDDERENICPRQRGPHTTDEQIPYKGGTTLQRNRNARVDTAPDDHYNVLISHDKYHDNATYGIQRTNSCWPPIGRCHSCGFHPQQRVGTACIALARICSSCGV